MGNAPVLYKKFGLGKLLVHTRQHGIITNREDAAVNKLLERYKSTSETSSCHDSISPEGWVS